MTRNRNRLFGLLAAVGAVTALAGCVAPGYYYGDQGYAQPYYGDQGYAQPYYGEPGPVVVAPPVSVGIGVGGGYWGGGGYYGRPGYYARPGYYPRPGYNGRPWAHAPGVPQQGGPRAGPRPGGPAPAATGRQSWMTGGERVITGPPGAPGPDGP